MARPGAPSAMQPRLPALRFPFGRRAPREGMVEKRPFLDFLTHAVLILGVAIIAFPVYVTFVASTITAEEVLDRQCLEMRMRWDVPATLDTVEDA